MFFLPQTRVEHPEEEEALESEYLQAAESTQAGQAPLRLLEAVEAEVPRRALRAVETPQPLPSGSLKPHQAPSRNTSAAVAGKLAALVALAFVSAFLPYPD